jgi:uncharacterized membrane protein YedE/YeeE
MTIDWNHFTPWASLAGGALIGLAAAGFVLLNGRVAGISGILGGLLFVPPQDRAWRVAFLAGLILALPLWLAFAPRPEFRIDAGWAAIVAAGLLVGIGTRYAAGCTSGHGVCGLSRFSLRSLVATLSFMGAGFVAVYVLRHLVGG